MSNALKIAIADDHQVVRLGVRAMLQQKSLRYEVAGEATTPSELLSLLAQTHIDVLVTDYSMDAEIGADGLRLIQRVRTLYPSLPIVVLTMMHNAAIFRSIASAGVLGIISKQSLVADLPKAIESAFIGRPYLSQGVAALLEETKPSLTSLNVPKRTELSPREIETLRLLGAGLGVNDIAKQLNRSKKTISGHKQTAMFKLGLENDAQLFDYMRTHNLM